MANLIQPTDQPPPKPKTILPFSLSGPFTAPWQAGLFLLLVGAVGVWAASNDTLGDVAIGILGVTVIVLLMSAIGLPIGQP